MSIWVAKAVVLLGFIATALIRAPHANRNRAIKVAETRKTALEACLLTFAWIGVFVPLIWVWTPLFAFADFKLHPVLLAVGTAGIVLSLWLFHRSHTDLGTNWSITLEVRESHRLVTSGVYRQIRHPMYSSLLLYGLSEGLVIPNWVAGPFYMAAIALVVACRLTPEERMMRDRFAGQYDTYALRTKRLIPGVW